MPALTTSGSPTFTGGYCLIDSTGPDIVTGPASLLNSTQAWIALRVEMPWANTSPPVASPIFFQWGTNTSNRFYLAYFNGTANWGCQRISGGASGGAVSIADSWSANTARTLVFAWTATQIKLSVNGAAFVTLADANIPTITAAFGLGSGDPVTTARQAGAKIHWAAAGSGTLSDANAATLHGFGNTDPAWGSVPGTPTFLWYADDATYLDAAPPAAPVAAFSGTPTTGPAPLTVQFTDESTGTPTSWDWDFGDTNTSTDQHPEHEYTAPGSYDVELEVTSAGGSDDEIKAGYITVTAPEPGIEGFSVAFDDPTLEPDPTWTRLA
jgi:PKD repeat protein